MKTSEYYSSSALRLLGVTPDMTTELVLFNGISYTAYQTQGRSVSFIYSVSRDALNYLFTPTAVLPGELLETVERFQLTALQPNSRVVVDTAKKGQPPKFRLESIVPLDEGQPLVSLDVTFEAVTPMRSKLTFLVTADLHSRLDVELHEFGSPMPTSIPAAWISRNLATLLQTERASIDCNNRWARELAEGGFAQSLLDEHFDITGSICSLKARVDAGSRSYSYELANSTGYKRTVCIFAR